MIIKSGTFYFSYRINNFYFLLIFRKLISWFYLVRNDWKKSWKFENSTNCHINLVNIKMTINSRNKLGKATKKNNEKTLRLIDIENRKKKNCRKRNFIKAKKR